MASDVFDLAGKRVYVAGHTGMVGSAIVRRLASENCEIVTTTRAHVDLTDPVAVDRFMASRKPHVVILAAAKVGGILANDSYPVDFLHDNLAIQVNVIGSAHKYDVEKLVFLGSSCIYPKFAPQPIVEDALLTGPLEPTNEWYALAKIAGIKSCQAYRRQYGRDFVSVMPTNLYGPHDNFDLATSHVMAALLAKAHAAKMAGRDGMEIWGSGTPLREFMHVDDCADAIVFVTKRYSEPRHINIGSGVELSILELARLVMETVGLRGEITFDRTKPDGTPRKLMDSSLLRGLGWSPRVELREGMKDFYAWYLSHERAAA